MEPRGPENHEEGDVGPEVVAVGYSMVLRKCCEVGYIQIRL